MSDFQTTSPVPNYVIEKISLLSSEMDTLLQLARNASISNGSWHEAIGKIAVQAAGLNVWTVDIKKYIHQEEPVESI